MYPKILQVEASRIVENSILINVIAEVSNAVRNSLEKSFKISGDRLLVLVNQKSAPPIPNTVTTQHVGKKHLQFTISGNQVNVYGLRFVDVYGGEYDANNSKRVVLQ